MHIKPVKSSSWLITLIGCLLSMSNALAQAPVMALPELQITSARGQIWTRADAEAKPTLTQVTAATPVRVLPGTTVSTDHHGHALISLAGVGSCMIGPETSVRLPAVGEKDQTLEFHSPGGVWKEKFSKIFMNLSAVEMARQGSARFVLKTSQLLLTLKGGRFFVIDAQQFSAPNTASVPCSTVGVHDGSLSILEPTKQQVAEVKAGSAVLVKPGEVGLPRPLTRAEVRYEICSKLAALGKEVPARLPASMKTTPAPRGGTVNSLGMLFVPVPGTTVRMCIHETRFQDYAAYIAANPGKQDSSMRIPRDVFWGWEDYPIYATWDEAQAFCAWLSQKEGKTYRLPTDEEWSHAAGIGRQEKRQKDTLPKDLSDKIPNEFPWGSAWPPPEGAANICDISTFASAPSAYPHDLKRYDDGFAGPAPVMRFKPNKLGIFDLAGNMAEWCEDWYDDKRQTRVLRGGGYGHRYEGDSFMLSSNRDYYKPDAVSVNNSFRLVLEQP